MSYIKADNLFLSYPILSGDSRSFKQDVLRFTVGSKVSKAKNKILTVDALRSINLDIQDGDRVGLIGHNGAGKSTLLKVITGVYKPTAGKITVEGRISSLLDIGVGMQPILSGYDNIKLRSVLLGLSQKEIAAILPDIEEFTDLGGYLTLPVKTYSSGMMVRLAFAISTAIHPDILILDETIGAGDAHFMKKAKKRMDDVINKANIVIMASHSNSMIQEVCNKVIWLDHGCIKQSGDVNTVIEEYMSMV